MIDLCFREVARGRMGTDPGYRQVETELGTALGHEGRDNGQESGEGC